MTAGWRRACLSAALGVCWSAAAASAQTVSQRGFVEGAGWFFPETASNDSTHAVGDLLVRDDLFYKPRPWLQAAAGFDIRANSHDQVADRWRLDMSDRTAQRPPLSVRRLSATITWRQATVEAGKQIIRWGKTDIVTPTDALAPRDFLNIVDGDFLAVRALRGDVQLADDTIEAVWAPAFTPSRIPLLNQRWTVIPASVQGVALADGGAVFPSGSQAGLRWAHVGQTLEYSLAFFNGFSHLPAIEALPHPGLPEIDVIRVYPSIRMYGADAALPGRWFTVKGEAAYVTSTSALADEYVLYVVQIERQHGEWLLVGGYAGDSVTRAGTAQTFAPDRGLSNAFVGRASYTIDANRSLVLEAAVRRNGHGAYAKAEYSQGRGEHWRVTVAGRLFGGRADDFLGQYRRNSHATLTLRYSF